MSGRDTREERGQRISQSRERNCIRTRETTGVRRNHQPWPRSNEIVVVVVVGCNFNSPIIPHCPVTRYYLCSSSLAPSPVPHLPFFPTIRRSNGRRSLSQGSEGRNGESVAYRGRGTNKEATRIVVNVAGKFLNRGRNGDSAGPNFTGRLRLTSRPIIRDNSIAAALLFFFLFFLLLLLLLPP